MEFLSDSSCRRKGRQAGPRVAYQALNGLGSALAPFVVRDSMIKLAMAGLLWERGPPQSVLLGRCASGRPPATTDTLFITRAARCTSVSAKSESEMSMIAMYRAQVDLIRARDDDGSRS